MHSVKDINGNIINGIKKDSIGGLVVDDMSSYNKYMQEKKLLERVYMLEKQVEQIKQTLAKLQE